MNGCSGRVELARSVKHQVVMASLLMFAGIQTALACTPPSQEIFASTEKRVRERYAQSASIELATIVDVQPISAPDERGNTVLKGDRVTFMIDRIFKGRTKRGDKIIVESTGPCAYSVAGNAALKNVWSLEGGVILPPRQWLLYRQANLPLAITESDLARPINEVDFDLQLLERWEKGLPK